MVDHQDTKSPRKPKDKKELTGLNFKISKPSLVFWCLGGEKEVCL